MPDAAAEGEAVDRAGLEFFEGEFLDFDATRERIAADLTARLDEIDVQASRATREASEKAAQVARVEADYLAQQITGDTFERLSQRLAQELAAAEAERDRLTANAHAVRASRRQLETLQRLAAIRTAVLDRKRTAEQAQDVDALRRAMHSALIAVYIDPWGGVAGCEPQDTVENPAAVKRVGRARSGCSGRFRLTPAQLNTAPSSGST
jgi:hypothetical protein